MNTIKLQLNTKQLNQLKNYGFIDNIIYNDLDYNFIFFVRYLGFDDSYLLQIYDNNSGKNIIINNNQSFSNIASDGTIQNFKFLVENEVICLFIT